MSKTSKKDFKIFKKAVRKYVKKYKLHSWCIYFHHTKDKSRLAYVNANTQGRAVTFVLCKHWGMAKITKKRLKDTAKHEVIHLILDALYQAGWSRFGTEENYLQANEAVAQHLTRLL